MAQALYAMGFHNNRQRLLVEYQAYLFELLHPALLTKLTDQQPLLPAPDFRSPRPFLLLRNVHPHTSLADMLNLLERHDAESTALAQAQNQPTTPILDSINHIIAIPAALLPPPRPNPRRPHQSSPPTTCSFLLIPRAGERVVAPTVLSALGQGGPTQNAIIPEIRRDLYLIAPIRRAANTAPGHPTSLAHPHIDERPPSLVAQIPIQPEP